MKKLLALMLTFIVGLTACLGMTACGVKYAMGKDMVKYSSQLEAVAQLGNSVDAVVIDSVMAGYYSTYGDYAGSISIVPNLILAQEEYGIAGRKEDEAFMSKINEALIGLYGAGTFSEIATDFGVQENISITSDTTDIYAAATDNSWNAIIQANKIVIGITIFAPIAFYDGATIMDNLTGFDVELARKVVDYLNNRYSLSLDVEFKIINWNSKEAELENGSIDLVWNGMTITEDRLNSMCISIPYLYNKQVAVVLTEDLDKYSDKDSFKNAIIGVEAGSAGEDVVLGK